MHESLFTPSIRAYLRISTTCFKLMEPRYCVWYWIRWYNIFQYTCSWPMDNQSKDIRNIVLLWLLMDPYFKGKYEGSLLVVVCFNDNSNQHSLAYEIIDKESNTSWSYFIRHLKTCIREGPNMVIVCLIITKELRVE